MRILSWNIAGVGPKAAARFSAITEAIASLDPDFVCLQEIGRAADAPETLARLGSELGMDGHLGVSSRERAQATALLWKPSVAEPRTPTTHYVLRFYHGLTWGTFTVPGLQAPLDVVSAHLHPHSPEARLDEASCFHMHADRGKLTAILGDFNNLGLDDPEPDWSATRPGNLASRCLPAPPGTPLVGDRRLAWRLNTAGYIDACTDADPAATASHIRVDWALLSTALAPALTGYRVGDDAGTGTKEATSDHRPIWCDLDLGRLAATA